MCVLREGPSAVPAVLRALPIQSWRGSEALHAALTNANCPPGGGCGWVGAVQERKRRTGTNELGVAGNTREIEQGLGDVRSQRVSACVRTAVANACTTVPLMLAPHCSHLCNNDKRVVRKGPMDGVNVQWLPGPLGERARDCMCLHCCYQCLYHCR